ncbi:MAG: hypothetical protein ABIP94_06040 [Planctomycetota bacterium]
MLLSTAALSGQSDRLQQQIQHAIADLGDPSKVAEAVRKLENLGPMVVPALREVLHYSRRPDAPVAVQSQALYVLGRRGRAAVSALPEVRDIIGDDNDGEVGHQALWTLSMLVPFLSDDACDAIEDLLKRRASRLEAVAGGIVMAQTRLGANPTTKNLLYHLDARGVQCIAACRWLAAHADEEIEQRQTLLDALSRRREQVMTHAALAWKDRPSERLAAVDLAEAWLAMSKQPLDALAARALLEHWHPDSRRRAVLWLQENGASLPLAERADLVARLWDVEPSILLSTCDAFAAWGEHGLVALAPLRLVQKSHKDAEVAARCGQAADRVLAACQGLAAGDRALLASIDAVLQSPSPPDLPADVAAGASANPRLAAEILSMAEWSGVEVLSALLEVVGRASADRADVLSVVFGLATSRQPGVAAVALAWLAGRGTALRGSLRALDVDLAFELAWLARFGVLDEVRTTAVEAAAWIDIGVDALLADVVAAIDSANLRFVARSLAELQRRGVDLGTAVPHLRDLTMLPAGQTLPLQVRGVERDQVLPFDLGEPVRVLAALALARLGLVVEAPGTETAGLDSVVRRRCGVGLSDLPAHVAQLRQTDHLRALLDELEADCRQRLGVPMHLAWPTVVPVSR